MRYDISTRYGGKPCDNGHMELRFIINDVCVRCAYEYAWKLGKYHPVDYLNINSEKVREILIAQMKEVHSRWSVGKTKPGDPKALKLFPFLGID